jgi:NAD(P)-dependent dehydrogenase (short-subunit alcohol dehydrogenase family)
MSEKQVVVVTGGATGIGKAISLRFAGQGAHVVASDIDRDVVALAEQGIVTYESDVSDSAAVGSMVTHVVERFRRLDVMVCNAGIGGGAPISEFDDELFRRIIDVNLFGVFACARAAARVMLPQRSGVIITIGSVFGQDAPVGTVAYSAAKAGVVAITQSLARELGPAGIRVNCVSPGHIQTEMYASALNRRAAAKGISLEEATEAERSPIPLGQFGSPDDVAKVVTYLASAEASYITGQRINVDGGLQPW